MPKRLRDRTPKTAPTITDEEWSAARRAAGELDKILDDGGSRQGAIARAAAELRLTTRQIYNLLARYRTARTVTAMLPRPAETRRKRLPADVEAIISTTLREQWLILEAPPLAPVVAEIRARCEEAGLAVPSYVSVARRIPTGIPRPHWRRRLAMRQLHGISSAPKSKMAVDTVRRRTDPSLKKGLTLPPLLFVPGFSLPGSVRKLTEIISIAYGRVIPINAVCRSPASRLRQPNVRCPYGVIFCYFWRPNKTRPSHSALA